MGGGVGRWPMEGGQGGRWGGGAPESSVGATKVRKRGSLQNPTTGLIWLVTREGGWGKAWGGGPWRAGKGGGGGHVGATKVALVKNLTTGLIWLVTRVGGWGEAWGGGPWRAGKGGDGGGGAPESSVGATKGDFFFGLPQKLNNGLIWLVTRVGEAWGGGPWRAGKGGDGGRAPESSVGARKGAPLKTQQLV